MVNDGVLEISERAARLLPEPPDVRDAFGYLAWEELVLSTARRLEPHLDRAAPRTVARRWERQRSRPRLDGRDLLILADLLVDDPDGTTCSSMLAEVAEAACGVSAATDVRRG